MQEFSASDSAYMAQALRLARRGVYTAHPNPLVGCVLVRGGEAIGQGWHATTGEAHAEVNALDAAGDAKGATAYVTLEPCAHHGRTPPCTDALIAAGISDVVIAMQDPFEAAGGRGSRALEKAGVKVRTGLMSEEAEKLNAGFFSRVRRGRPFVRLKVATSLDGAIAMRSGESQWITGPAARSDVQRLRARSGAIMSGIGTVLADDPSFSVRDETIDTAGRQPLRVVLDSTLRMPLSSGMLCLPGRTLIYCVDDQGRGALEAEGAEVVKVGEGCDGGGVDIAAVLEDLGRKEINDLLVEAGPILAGRMMSAALVDELIIYQAPHIMGSETNPMFSTPNWTSLADRKLLEISDARRVGSDTRITASIKRAGQN
jgi:diaminohydroxyphosphoribosylaminopyrimidine deaminase/5-amino-6-(5-phosphoribosylamino)uracil reductase